MYETINIGRTIVRERRRAGMTQEALATHLGVSKAAVSKWELGQSLPDVSLLPRIAAYFSLSLDELFDWRDELTEEESAALYAEVYALGEADLPAAHERLRALAEEHYSDANLLLMFASLLTVWAAGMATPFTPPAEQPDGAGDGNGDAPRALPDADGLIGEALALIDRVLQISAEPATLFLAHQQKATTLFQAGRYEETAFLLEPLVRRQDTGAPTMLLASAYRKLGRDGEAFDLLQTERLRAANFVLSSLAQEVGMRDDVAFAQAADAAAGAVFETLRMGAINPFFPATMALEVAEALRRAGERDGALIALGRAVDAASRTPAEPDPTVIALWDHLGEVLDPARSGKAWAEHKTRQTDALRRTLRQHAVERALSPEWRAFAGDDTRYLKMAASLERDPT